MNKANMTKFLEEKSNENAIRETNASAHHDIPLSEDPLNGIPNNSLDSKAQSNTRLQNVNFDNQNNDYNNTDQYIGSTNLYNSQTNVFNDPDKFPDSYQSYHLNEQVDTFLNPAPLTPPLEHNIDNQNFMPPIPPSAERSDDIDSMSSHSSESVTDSHVMDDLNCVPEKSSGSQNPSNTCDLTHSNAQNKSQQGYALDKHLPKACKNCHDGKIRELSIKRKLNKIYDANKIMKDNMAALDAKMNKLNEIINIFATQQPSPKQSRRNH